MVHRVDAVSLPPVQEIRGEPVGQYAVQPHFSDGHSTGIYSWDHLYWLGQNRDALWQRYLDDLARAGASRGGEAPPDELVATEIKRGAGR